jgi:nitroimidazol reductase NimA-like FMN-containing flavoprotein (pyridoxamine 5'-phosphate oxidase superfamily)
MLIESMTRQASIDLLKRARVARLGYIHDGQPYIVPMLFAYNVNYLYSISTEGQKIDCMRANPRVCVEADDLVTMQQWETVVVLGQYEDLPHTEEHETSRAHAHALLQSGHPAWLEPGFVKTMVDGRERPLEVLYFRIHIDQIIGRRGLPG